MNLNTEQERAVFLIERELDDVIDELQIGRDLSNQRMTEVEYRAFILGKQATLQSLFKLYETYIPECDCTRIEAKLDILYDFAHNKVEMFDPFNL